MNDDLNMYGFRAALLGPATADDSTLSVEAVASTQERVAVLTEEPNGKMRVVEEVLLMSGCLLPDSRQLPLVDSHNRSTVNNVLGSVRNIRVDGKRLVGRLYFSPDAARTYRLVRDGHITDVSIGYARREYVRIREGQAEEIEGQSFAGPVDVVTEWRPHELSVVVVGADRLAKMRSENQPEDDGTTREADSPELQAATAKLADAIAERDEARSKLLALLAKAERENKHPRDYPEWSTLDFCLDISERYDIPAAIESLGVAVADVVLREAAEEAALAV
jgi:hypothetical protein